MNRQTLADVLQGTNQTGSYTLATVLEGAETGSQLLLRDGAVVWQTQSTELLQRQLSALQACTATGFLTLDGQRDQTPGHLSGMALLFPLHSL